MNCEGFLSWLQLEQIALCLFTFFFGFQSLVFGFHVSIDTCCISQVSDPAFKFILHYEVSLCGECFCFRLRQRFCSIAFHFNDLISCTCFRIITSLQTLPLRITMQTTEPRFCHMEDQQRRNVNKKKRQRKLHGSEKFHVSLSNYLK